MDLWSTQIYAGQKPSISLRFRQASLRVGIRICRRATVKFEMGRQGSSLMQVRLLWFWRNHRMRNRHPARLLLLPDCHHVHRMLRKGLAITAAPHGGGISHDKRLAVEFSFKLAQREIL